jgi:perosamine synthetase
MNEFYSGNLARFRDWKISLQRTGSLNFRLNNSYNFQTESNLEFNLVALNESDLDSEKLINYLSEWRIANRFAYPTRSPISESGTRAWLSKAVLENPYRVLFWIVNQSMDFLGHIGITIDENTSSLELDNVLRGSKGNYPGLMTGALHKIEGIAELEFSVESLFLRVLESNSHAVNFYIENGYEILKRESLEWQGPESDRRLTPGIGGDDTFLTMVKDIRNPNTEISLPVLTAGPSISPLEVSLVGDAVQNGWNAHNSDYLQIFESEFAELVGSKYAMATSSCTGALHLSLLALGIGPGDEVIVPGVTWVATASAVMYVGAKPVFADIDLTTWTIDLMDIERKISKATKAIIPVHLYGYAANMPEILKLANSYGIKIIEDAAPAIGTLIENKSAGTFGDFGCYSFQGAKLLVTGEGGMLVTDNEELFKKAKKMQDHGRKPGTFWIEEIGYKYKMNNVTAALGLGQIRRAENQIFRKQRINGWYKELLGDIEGLKFQESLKGTSSICWMSSFALSAEIGVDRDRLIGELKNVGIDSRPVFPSINRYKIWKYDGELLQNSELIGGTGINLPSGVNLNHKTIEFVATHIRNILLN